MPKLEALRPIGLRPIGMSWTPRQNLRRLLPANVSGKVKTIKALNLSRPTKV